ncbi:MAG TPA: hypothetical protein VFY49_00275 [Myxococcota bacterium]|nr:hypothetical protein [Myxococcota bacterium]
MERESDWVAAVEAPAYEAEEAFDQRCVSRGDDLSRLRALETRIGDVLNTPIVSLMSQIALHFEVLI